MRAVREHDALADCKPQAMTYQKGARIFDQQLCLRIRFLHSAASPPNRRIKSSFINAQSCLFY